MKYIRKRTICILFLITCIAVYYIYAPSNTVRTRSEDELRCDNTETNWNTISTWNYKDIPITKKNIKSETKRKYYDLLKDIHEILTNNGIKYVLGAGTLLGSYRHGDIIPWDDDADICIKFEDHDRLRSLRPIFKKKGITVDNGCISCWADYYKDVCEYINDRSAVDSNFSTIPMEKPCRDTQYFAALKRGDIHVDVFHLIPIYDKDNRKMYTVYGNNRLISEAQAKAMFDIKKCPFGSLSLNCPSNTKELLCHEYNNNLQFPTIAGIKNKNVIPGMWSSGMDKDAAYFMKDDKNNYIIKNFKHS
jgi:hypothetical protein